MLLPFMLLLLPNLSSSTVVPGQFSIQANPVVSVNGSFSTGICSQILGSPDGTSLICPTPATSVLFDGDIPTLTGLDGDMWASQLFTVERTTGSIVALTLDFTALGQAYNGFTRVSVAIFNCPLWGIGVTSVDVLTSQRVSFEINSSPISCESLVTACIDVRLESRDTSVTLEFNLLEHAHLGEVMLIHDVETACPEGKLHHLNSTFQCSCERVASMTQEILAKFLCMCTGMLCDSQL